ncbi:hypothetical protein PHLGIDRAFT_113969 [Phlebiopsis gigantea 11061_1 CR5-6]|uniref:DUF6534 domain-containing protein n=1 Tax=Phlebiopsis gigantea (strain 11061_1 CR5-6) TaxID=745531 RepID=A0A0C3SFJ4_PHLG1|nr:hypothetical protein PHLGIDRAFT_113969 [Phlebiopsis gigantea 11061_1 CR5-6]
MSENCHAGPMLVGFLLNWGLFGALSIQLFFYYLSFPKDRWGAKLLVAFIYLLEATQTFIITRDCFQIYVIHYGETDSLNELLLEGIMVPIFTAVVSCAVQFFYAYRLHLLFKKRYIVTAICVLSAMQLIAGVFTGIRATMIGTYSGLQLSRAMQIGEGLWLIGSAVCDALIATSMIYLLLKANTHSRTTHNLINKVVRLVIETGSLTAVMAVLSLILYYSFPGLPYHVPVATVLSKLYSNSALAIFNSRIHIVGGKESTDHQGTVHLSVSRGSRRPLTRTLDTIHIQEDVYVHADDIPLERSGSSGGKHLELSPITTITQESIDKFSHAQ